MKTYHLLNSWCGVKWQSRSYMQTKWIKKDKKKNVTAAVVAALLLTACGGQQLYAEEYYWSEWGIKDGQWTRWDMDGNTTWDDNSSTAILHADKSIGRVYTWVKDFGLQSHTGEGHFMSLISPCPEPFYSSSYSVEGAVGTEKLTLTGDIVSIDANSITVKNLNTLQITQGTYGLDATYGNQRSDKPRPGGIYIENVKNVDISGTVGAVYGDARAKIELTGIENLSLSSDMNRKKEYGNYTVDENITGTTIDNTIHCEYGSEVDIDAKSTFLKANGRAIVAAAHNADNINHYENASWETDTPFPVIKILSDTLTIAAATQGESAAAVYSDAGGIIQLGSEDRKIKKLLFDENAGANMNLYSDSYVYEEKNSTAPARYSDTIADGKTAEDYILHHATIDVHAEDAEFHANTNAINARNNSRISVNATKANINNKYGNVATVSSSGGSEVAITGEDVSITNHNTNYMHKGEVTAAKNAKLAIAGGGEVNPSRKDLQKEYGGTQDTAGNIRIDASKTLQVDGDVLMDAQPEDAKGNSVVINKNNTTALVNVTGNIYTNNGNTVQLNLGDGSNASQEGKKGKSSLTGRVLDAASATQDFAFQDTHFSDQGTQLNMQDASWYVTGDSEVSAVNMNGSSLLDLTYDKGYQKVKINTLSGTGTIKMDFDDSQISRGGSTADKLFINNHSGTQYLYLHEVNDRKNLTGNAAGTVLASVVNENGAFKAASDDALTWRTYALDRKASDTEGYQVDWYLKKGENTPEPSPVPQGPVRSAAAALQAGNANYYLWRDQNERLTKRLGMYCFDEDREGIWAKMGSSRIGSSGVYGSDASIKTYTLGYDFKHHPAVPQNTATGKPAVDFSGVAFTYMSGKSDMNGYNVYDDLRVNGGTSDIHGGAVTVYHTHISKPGAYSDYVARYSSYDNHFRFDGVQGTVKSRGFQLGAEYGYRWENDKGIFVTPNTQLTLGRLYNRDFTTSNGVHASLGHVNSAVLSLGVDVGQTCSEQGQVYAKVRYNKELGNTVRAALYQDNTSAFYDSGSNRQWWEYGLGVDFRAGKAAHVYADAERASGGNFQKNWSWRIGTRFDF